jgi:hypothetical protein
MDFHNGTGPARGIKRPIAVLGLASRAGGGEMAEPACSGRGPQGVAQSTERRGKRSAVAGVQGLAVTAAAEGQRPAPAKPRPAKERNMLARE